MSPDIPTIADADVPSEVDVAVVGGGVSGLTASIFTARADLETLVINAGGSILHRNALLENFPGFPAGVNSSLLLEMIEDQARRAGAQLVRGKVVEVRRADDGEAFEVETEEGVTVTADRVVAASWSDASYLDPLGPKVREDGKTFLQPDSGGRTEIDGLYAAGRLADRPHQAIVAAGDGGETGVSVVEDADVDLYHDWVVPNGYFTLRDREVPPGCQEVTKKERRRRERESVEVMRDYFVEEYGPDPVPHPNLEGEEGFDA
jgi:thioredoxin reductase